MTDSARRRGFDVVIVPLIYWLYFERSWWYWKNFAGRFLPNVVRLALLIRRRDIDLVYTNTSAVFEPALASRLMGVPHIWHIHEVLKDGNAMNQLLPLRTIKGLIGRMSDRLIFESDAARRVFEETVPRAKSEVVYNSLRSVADRRDGEVSAARSMFDLEPSDEVVAFVGQLIDRKNPLLLLRAIDRLRHRPDLKCVFVGDGPLREQLCSSIRLLGLEDRCRVFGFQPDVRPLMEVLDVLVLPSRQESFGLVLLEAAAHGKPVIACISEGPSEIILPGQTGLLVPQNDPGPLAQAIEALFDGTIDRHSMGADGERHIKKIFNAATNTRRLESIIYATVNSW